MKKLDRWLAGIVLAGVLGAGAASAATFRFADQGDAISMDPHSLNETLQLNITGNMYEPLVARGKKLELVPLLAASFKQTAPTVWRFNLRQGVKFHDGSPFTADDVIFSYERSKSDGSDMKTKIGSVKEIKKVDDPAEHHSVGEVADCTAGKILAVTCEPPEKGPSGSQVSPSSTVTFVMGMPSASAAIWPSAV